MRKLGILLMAMVLVIVVSVGVMALNNPWENDGDRVNVELQVAEWGEVYSTIGTDQARGYGVYADPIVLKVNNAGGIIPEEGKVEDSLSHMANVDYEVSVTLDGTIPEYTRFFVILNPDTNYDGVAPITGTAVTADKVIMWDRRDSATGYLGNQPSDNISLLTGTSTISANSDTIHYAMDAIHALPPKTDANISVIYTIAAQ